MPRFLSVALFVLFSSCPSFSQCAPELWNAKNGPFREYRGQYQNGAYGYSTVIPKGFVGLDGKNPLYQRGFAIPLQKNKALLAVSAAPNSLEYSSSQAAAEGALAMYRQHQRNILSSELQTISLGGEPAETVRVRFRCPPSGTEYLLLETVSVANAHVYTITWQGPAAAFDHASAQVLSNIVRNWKYGPIK